MYSSLKNLYSLFERGAASVGNDILAGSILWDKYIEFESSQEEFARVAQIYHRILHVPLLSLANYWERCASAHCIAFVYENVLTVPSIRFKLFASSRPVAEVATAEERAYFASQGVTDENEQRTRLLASREEVFRRSTEEANKRRPFESNVCRAYCHCCRINNSCRFGDRISISRHLIRRSWTTGVSTWTLRRRPGPNSFSNSTSAASCRVYVYWLTH